MSDVAYVVNAPVMPVARTRIFPPRAEKTVTVDEKGELQSAAARFGGAGSLSVDVIHLRAVGITTQPPSMPTLPTFGVSIADASPSNLAVQPTAIRIAKGRTKMSDAGAGFAVFRLGAIMLLIGVAAWLIFGALNRPVLELAGSLVLGAGALLVMFGVLWGRRHADFQRSP